MEIDKELLEIFTDEIGELKGELTPIFDKLKTNVQQPQLFLDFEQIIDRIYGTALTMGFTDVGNYLGLIRNMSRKCGSSKVPRAMAEVFKLLKVCMENFDSLGSSLSNPVEHKALLVKFDLEKRKAAKIDREIFAFSKDAKTTLR